MFVAVGLTGFVIDAAITYAATRGLGMSPYLARLPAFALATIVNFALNRRITFAHTQTALWPAFLRYRLICGLGFAVNWSAYSAALFAARRLGLPTPDAALPVFVAFGSGVAMFVTFFGFKRFAFRV